MQKDQMPVHRFKKYEELGLTSRNFEQNHRKSRILIEDLKIFSKCKNKCTYYHIEIKIKGKKFLYVKTEFKKDIEEIFNIFLNIIEEKRYEKILY